jgi:hypothetical protein
VLLIVKINRRDITITAISGFIFDCTKSNIIFPI